MWQLLVSALFKYFEQHPDQIVDLIGQGVQAGINNLKLYNANHPSNAATIVKQ